MYSFIGRRNNFEPDSPFDRKPMKLFQKVGGCKSRKTSGLLRFDLEIVSRGTIWTPRLGSRVSLVFARLDLDIRARRIEWLTVTEKVWRVDVAARCRLAECVRLWSADSSTHQIESAFDVIFSRVSISDVSLFRWKTAKNPSQVVWCKATFMSDTAGIDNAFCVLRFTAWKCMMLCNSGFAGSPVDVDKW